MFTVKQLSKMAGVTPQTLRHYEDVGLFKPSRIGDNGYRYYGEEALLKLQQILCYRELDFPLEDIKKIMAPRLRCARRVTKSQGCFAKKSCAVEPSMAWATGSSVAARV